MTIQNIIGWILALSGFAAFTLFMVYDIGAFRAFAVYALSAALIGFLWLVFELISHERPNQK